MNMLTSLEHHLMAQADKDPNQISRESRSNFLKALFFLDKEQKRALEAIYAFARVLDDAVDDWTHPEEQSTAIHFWESRYRLLQNGHAEGLLMSELKWAIDGFGIDPTHLEALIRGCKTDIFKHRYATFTELEAYCYDVASSIGLMTLPVFRIQGQNLKTLHDQSIALGKALQLTNILRDVYEDSQRGRIYLPLEDLTRFRYSPEFLHDKIYNSDFHALMCFEADRAEGFFQKADKFLQIPDNKGYVAPWLMGATYHQLLDNLRSKRFNVFKGKISLSKRQRILLMLKALCRLLRVTG